MIQHPEFNEAMICDSTARDLRERWLREMAESARLALDSGVDIRTWIADFQCVRREILRQVWEATIPERLRVQSAYVRFGSSGREEDLLSSDLDHGIITDSREVSAGLVPYLGEFITRMNQFGCPVCQGFVMSTNPRWLGTTEEWSHRIRGYFQFPDWENVRYLFITLDGRPLGVNTEWWTPVHEQVLRGIQKSPFVWWEMAHLGIHKSVALGWFRRVRMASGAARDAVNVKDGLITPILHSIRLLAVAHGHEGNSTWARLDYVNTNQLLPDDLFVECTDTLKSALVIRLRKQIADILAGREPSDVVGMGSRDGSDNHVERDTMVRHLEVAKELERFVHRQFRKPR